MNFNFVGSTVTQGNVIMELTYNGLISQFTANYDNQTPPFITGKSVELESIFSLVGKEQVVEQAYALGFGQYNWIVKLQYHDFDIRL
jgi:hypothetical protein